MKMKVLFSTVSFLFFCLLLPLSSWSAVLENDFYRLKLTEKAPFGLEEIFNKETNTSCLENNSFSTLLAVTVDGRPLLPESFQVKEAAVADRFAGKEAVFSLENPAEKISCRLTAALDKSRELVFSLSVTNNGDKERRITAVFPLLNHLKAGGKLEDTLYFFPYMQGWVSGKPYDLALTYGGSLGGFQVVSLFNPVDGSGLYCWVKDNTGRMKDFFLRKMERAGRRIPVGLGTFDEMGFPEDLLTLDRGITIIARSYPYNIKPGQTVRLPDTVVGIGRTGWREPLDSYTGWVRTWWKAPRVPQTYRESYGYVVSHDITGGYGFESGFIKDNKWVMAEKINTSTDHRIQLAYWGQHSYTDQEGDTRNSKWYPISVNYDAYEETWGGLPALKEAIRQTQAKGVPVVLYGACPQLIYYYDEALKKLPDIRLLTKDGKEPRWWWLDNTPRGKMRMLDVCPQVEAWQDFMAENVGRLARETGCQGIYLDTANGVPPCYNPAHKHYEYPSVAAENYLKKIQAAVKAANPDCMVEVEDVGSDYLMQWVDASWSKTFGGDWRPNDQNFDAYGVSFLRFYFPEISFSEWGPLWDFGAKRCFFNGMGYCRNNPNSSTDPATGRIITADEKMAWFAKACGIFKENGDAFTSLKPVPLIPTLPEKVYANEFPAGEKTVYTFFNKSDRDVSGNVFTVSASPDEHFVEFFSGQELPAEFANGKATVSFVIQKGDVACVGKIKKALEISKENGLLLIKTRGKFNAFSLKIIVERDDGNDIEKEVRLDNGAARLNLQDFVGCRRVIVKLFDGKYLVDERVVKF